MSLRLPPRGCRVELASVFQRLSARFVAQEKDEGEAPCHLGPLDRAARIADLKEKLTTCLEEMDRLELLRAGNYLSHAIAILDGER